VRWFVPDIQGSSQAIVIFHPFRPVSRENWTAAPLATVRQAWQSVQWRLG
jgi:hypothetical protein